MTVTVNEAATGAATSSAARSNQRLTAMLVTGDDALWPLVGAVLGRNVVLKQIDSIDQLIGGEEPDQGGVVIWDARGASDTAAPLARVRQALPSTAVMVLDDPAMMSHWQRLVEQRLIASMAALPIAADSFNGALDLAFDEAQIRRGVLGTPGKTTAAAEAPPSQGRSRGLMVGVAVGIVVLCGAAAFFLFGSKPAGVPSAE
ncbi:MAG: hypothetical protein M3N97_11200 [Pseudomonadota bacterium]|nr:hypothetical protein [Pseudomonadota bacterium]